MVQPSRVSILDLSVRESAPGSRQRLVNFYSLKFVIKESDIISVQF